MDTTIAFTWAFVLVGLHAAMLWYGWERGRVAGLLQAAGIILLAWFILANSGVVKVTW